jgi:hypothetical protein
MKAVRFAAILIFTVVGAGIGVFAVCCIPRAFISRFIAGGTSEAVVAIVFAGLCIGAGVGAAIADRITKPPPPATH